MRLSVAFETAGVVVERLQDDVLVSCFLLIERLESGDSVAEPCGGSGFLLRHLIHSVSFTLLTFVGLHTRFHASMRNDIPIGFCLVRKMKCFDQRFFLANALTTKINANVMNKAAHAME